MSPKKIDRLDLRVRLLSATIATCCFLLGSLLIVPVDPNFAYAQVPNNLDETNGDDLSDATVPTFDFNNNFDKSIVVLLEFTALNEAEFVGSDVSYGPPRSNIGNPPSLRVQIYDYSGDIIQQFFYWHPLFYFEFQEDGSEYLKVSQNAVVGRFVYAFDPNAALMKVSYLHHDGINSTWAEEVISVDLIPTISKFCNEFPTDPDCKSSDLSVIDVSASNGQQQLSLPIGSSADVTLQTTVTNTGPDTPIDAILSSNVITPSESRGVLVTPAAGANPNNNGATTTRTILASLNEAQQDGQTYTIECWEPGIHDIIFESEIAPQSGAVDDANQLNNKGQLKFAVDCGVNGIIPPPVPLGVSIEANVTEDGSPPTTIEFRAITGGGTQPHKFRWNFDDGEGNSNDNNVKGDQLMTHQFTRLGQHNVTVTVTDSANGFRGQTASDNIIVTISDKEPPQISVPRQIIAEARGPNGANVTFTVSATDIVDGSVPVSCRAQSSGTFQSGTTTANFKLGTTTVNCHATDSSGNTGYGNFTVTVQDTTPPIITVPEDIVVEATGPEGAKVNFTVSATDVVDGKATLDRNNMLIQDNVGGSITISCNPASPSTLPVGGHTVQCSATDEAGNTATASFTVTVQDTTPPIITVPEDIVVEATGPEGAVANFTVSATDVVDGKATLGSNGALIQEDQDGRDIEISCNPRSGSTFELGTTTVNCYAEDSSRNRVDGSFSVTVQDTTPPIITVPEDIVVEATGPEGAKVNFTVSATDVVDGKATLDRNNMLIQDNVGGSITISCNPASPSTLPVGGHTVQCSATDEAGNTATASFTVTVQDTTPPIITVPEDIVVEATGPEGAKVNFTVSATDVVDGKATLEEDGVLIQGDNIRGNITISCNPRSGDTFELGDTAPSTPASAATSGSVFMQSAPSTSVNCYAEDSSDNGVNGSFSVTVRDTTPSTITISSPSITFEAPPPDNTILTSTPAVPLNPLMVRLQVNSAPASAPTSDILFVQIAATPNATVTFFVVATDIVDGKATLGKNDILIQGDNIRGNITIDCDPASGFKLLLNETRTVNCYAQDSSGNRATDSFQVTAQDTTSPTITIPPSISNQTTIPPPPPTITIPPSISNQTTPLLPPPPPPSLAIPPSISDQPTDEEPTDEEPTDEEPTDEEPTDEEPTDEEPTDEEPTDEEPTDEEPTD